MKGKHSIVVRNRRVQFALELERNITVIRGDSATGKTTMLGMLRDYEELEAQSGVAVQCDKPCRTLTSRDWESQLSRMKDSIVFVDEGNAFVSSRAFAQAICGSRARCKILCKRFSTKSRMALESRADSGLNPLITESHGGQSGMRAGTA